MGEDTTVQIKELNDLLNHDSRVFGFQQSSALHLVTNPGDTIW